MRQSQKPLFERSRALTLANLIVVVRHHQVRTGFRVCKLRLESPLSLKARGVK